jgi:hypothetical protein
MWEQIGFSLMFGLVSSIGICLASCTPVLIAYLISTERDPRKFIGWMILFVALRAIVFVAVTILILMLGRLAIDFIKQYALLLRIIGGAVILAAGVLIFFDIGSKLKFFRTKSKGFMILSFLFGIKPCIPHIAIWGYILTVVAAPMLEGTINLLGAVLSALAISLSFSVGENVLPVFLGALGGKSIRYFRGDVFKIVSKVCGALLFVLGIIFIFYDRVAPFLARVLA